jgi:hypothetical protein
MTDQGERWPTDPSFRKFASRIADAVTLHLAKGGRISVSVRSDDDRCPLGTVFPSGDPHPHGGPAAIKMGFPYSFGDDFDNGICAYRNAMDTPAYRLGRAYRERFVTKTEARYA